MKIAFWNLYKKENSKLIIDLLKEYNIDVAIFAEHEGLNISRLKFFNSNYVIADNMGICDKLLFVYRKEIIYTIRHEQYRYAIHSFSFKNIEFIIVGLHLQSNSHASSDDRKAEIPFIISDLNRIESKMRTRRTFIIGDFNASPFDSELTQKNMFNAVMYKEIIRKQDIIKYQRRKYRRFYNPMIHYINENNQDYGTYYYIGEINSLLWYCYDQVIVRKELIDLLKNISFCKSIGSHLLLTNQGIPNKNISDHLPLIVEVNI